MPAKDTMCIDLGNWIMVFYVVYIMGGIAVLLAVSVLTNLIVNMMHRRRLVKRDKLTQSSLAGSV